MVVIINDRNMSGRIFVSNVLCCFLDWLGLLSDLGVFFSWAIGRAFKSLRVIKWISCRWTS